MFFQGPQEQQHESNSKKIKELQIQWEHLTKEIDSFLLEHGLDLNALHDHFSDAGNFTASDWEMMQKMQREQEERLEATRQVQADPRATQQKYQERSNIDHRWLFIR